MEQICQNKNCKKKLTDYRELNRKLYDDIDSVESDLKERDDFVHKVVKARNDFQKEVEILKKKNSELMKDNDDLIEKNDQLDEDTEDGIKMLRNAHERERKLKNELDEFKEKVIKDAEKIFELEKERSEMQSKFLAVKNKFSKSLKENQEMFMLKEIKIKEIEKEIVKFKESKDKTETNNEHLECDTKLQENIEHLHNLEEENNILKQKKDDLIDELEIKKGEVKDLKIAQINNKLKNSGTSLKEELEQIKLVKCNKCQFTFVTLDALNDHKKNVHSETVKSDLMQKIDSLKVMISDQKANSISSLYKLKEEERKSIQNCGCKEKEYCRINHQKYSYIKSQTEGTFRSQRNGFHRSYFWCKKKMFSL